MKKRFILFVLSILVSFASVSAQTRGCGSVAVQEKLLQEDPSSRLKKNRLEAYTKNYARRLSKTTPSGIVVVPVVIHVLYKDASQNISDAQIQSQLEVLNQDYRKLNSDFSLTPAVFQAVGADMAIQFELANRDPSGNPTTGIIRKEVSASFSVEDDYYDSTKGGSATWNPIQYLNIWVGDIGNGLLGFAYGPEAVGRPEDGAVISYKAFGTVGTSVAPFNKGRTTTHELGHYFNLAHLWGPSDNETSCGATDGVADTPPQKAPDYGTPIFPVGPSADSYCPASAPNGPMFMNYMDYVDDIAMHLFTEGQKTRAQAALLGARSGLIDSPGFCTETIWYRDADGDGLGNPNDSILACEQPAGYVSNDDDPDDNACTKLLWYRDADGDGLGDPNDSVLACLQPQGYVSNNIDNDDKIALNIVISPNPITQNSFTIHTPYVVNQVSVFDRHGKLVHLSYPQAVAPTIKMDLVLVPGLYYGVFQTSGGKIKTAILVK